MNANKAVKCCENSFDVLMKAQNNNLRVFVLIPSNLHKHSLEVKKFSAALRAQNLSTTVAPSYPSRLPLTFHVAANDQRNVVKDVRDFNKSDFVRFRFRALAPQVSNNTSLE